MAIDHEERALKVTRRERTFRFDGYVRLNQEPHVDIYRETFWQADNGEVIGNSTISSRRRMWSEIEGRKWTLADGTVLTAPQMFEGLALAFDDLVQPDPVPEPEPEPAPEEEEEETDPEENPEENPEEDELSDEEAEPSAETEPVPQP